EGLGLEHVDTGVDRVAGDLVWLRLLQEPGDAALGVGLDQPVGTGIVNRRQHDRGPGFGVPVTLDHGADVHRGHDVAVEHDQRVGDALCGIADRAAGAERSGLDHVADADTHAFAFAEHLFDAARLVV